MCNVTNPLVVIIFSLLTFCLSAQQSFHQVELSADATHLTDVKRQLLKLENVNNGEWSLVATQMTSGTGSNQAFGALGVTAHSYTHTPGMAGYTYLFTNSTGLALRSENPTGNIKFITGGYELLHERMRIDHVGNVGISTTTPVAKLHVADGDVYIEDINKGIIMKSPDGNCWRGTLDNSGKLNFSSVACPN